MSFADARGQAFRLMLSTADELASVIGHMDWTLLTSEEGEFVTSDRALARYVPR
jgi:ketosteroid isomerase-like protein